MPSHRVLSAAPALLARPLPCFAIPHRPIAGMSVSLFNSQTSGLTDWSLSSALRSVVSAWLSALRGSHYTYSQLGVQIRYGTTPRNPLQTLAPLGVSNPQNTTQKTRGTTPRNTPPGHNSRTDRPRHHHVTDSHGRIDRQRHRRPRPYSQPHTTPRHADTYTPPPKGRVPTGKTQGRCDSSSSAGCDLGLLWKNRSLLW